MIVTPERWYQCFWILYAIVALIAARMFLVNPLIRAIEALRK
jgi:hypothetical protein